MIFRLLNRSQQQHFHNNQYGTDRRKHHKCRNRFFCAVQIIRTYNRHNRNKNTVDSRAYSHDTPAHILGNHCRQQTVIANIGNIGNNRSQKNQRNHQPDAKLIACLRTDQRRYKHNRRKHQTRNQQHRNDDSLALSAPVKHHPTKNARQGSYQHQ